MICQEHESAYWDGSKGVCCDGNVYQPDTEDTSYACCPTGKEVSIVQGKENLNHCCSEGQKAYWNGSSAQCCATATHQIVTNYISGQTETAYACCETKEDERRVNGPYNYGGTLYVTDTNTSTGYTIAGAVNGSCCGGYTSSSLTTDEYYTDSPQTNHGACGTESEYAVYENGGTYYCASSYVHQASGSTFSGAGKSGCGWTNGEGKRYLSASKYCTIVDFEPWECKCSSSGDPKNASTWCDP